MTILNHGLIEFIIRPWRVNRPVDGRSEGASGVTVVMSERLQGGEDTVVGAQSIDVVGAMDEGCSSSNKDEPITMNQLINQLMT